MANTKKRTSSTVAKALKIAKKSSSKSTKTAENKRKKAGLLGQLTKDIKKDIKKVASWKVGKGQNYPQSNVWTEKSDKEVVAKPVGYRWTDEGAKKVGKSANSRPTASDVEKYTGKTFRIPRKPNPASEDGSYRYIYQEKRVDKSDLSQKKKFEEGGETLAKGGGVKRAYKIIQDTEGIYEQGFYLVVDTSSDKLIDIFEFKSEAEDYLKEIKEKGVENVDSSNFNGQKNKYAKGGGVGKYVKVKINKRSENEFISILDNNGIKNREFVEYDDDGGVEYAVYEVFAEDKKDLDVINNNADIVEYAKGGGVKKIKKFKVGDKVVYAHKGKFGWEDIDEAEQGGYDRGVHEVTEVDYLKGQESIKLNHDNFWVHPNHFDLSDNYAKGGGVNLGNNYNILYEKPNSDIAWKETINANSIAEAQDKFKKKHPTCKILNISEEYSNGGGIGEWRRDNLGEKGKIILTNSSIYIRDNGGNVGRGRYDVYKQGNIQDGFRIPVTLLKSFDDLEEAKQYGYNSKNSYAKGGEVKKITDGDNVWYLTYIDSTHFFLSNSPDSKGNPYHIGQLKNKPYYNEVNEWLESHNSDKRKELGNWRGEYLTITADKNKMVIKLTKDGVEEVNNLKESGKSDSDIMYELFEDITANSELIYHNDLGNSGFGLTSASGVTDGYIYMDNGEFEAEDESARLYYFNEYMIKSEIDELLKGQLVLSGSDNQYSKGGGVENDERLQILLKELGVSQDYDDRAILNVENTKNIGKILGITTSAAYKYMRELESKGIAFKYGYKTRDGWEDPSHSTLNSNSLYWQIEIAKYAKGGQIDMDKHIWEGWTVGDFIQELEIPFQYHRKFSSRDEVKAWAMSEQPYYKKYIKEVVDYYWDKNNQKYAKGGGIRNIEWSNDENKQLGTWLLTSVDGKNILSKSKNANELEKNVMAYYENKGSIAKMVWNEDEDEGLSWVTFHDLYNEVNSIKYAKGGSLKSKAKYIPNILVNEIEIEKNGKTIYVDGADTINGLYVKRKVKYADGGETMIMNGKSMAFKANYKPKKGVTQTVFISKDSDDTYSVYDTDEKQIMKLNASEFKKHQMSGELELVKVYSIDKTSLYEMNENDAVNYFSDQLKSVDVDIMFYNGDVLDVNKSGRKEFDEVVLSDFMTESEFKKEIGYDIQDFDQIVDTEGNELEELYAENTYNWSYLGKNDYVFRVYQDTMQDRVFLVVSPHKGGDPRGNYGAAFIKEYDDKDAAIYDFAETLSFTKGVYFDFKDGSNIRFFSQQHSDVHNFEADDEKHEGMALTLEEYMSSKFKRWEGDEFLNDIIRDFDNEKDIYRKGGRLTDKYKYIPNIYVAAAEVERRGKTTEIDGADIYNGIYVKKGKYKI